MLPPDAECLQAARAPGFGEGYVRICQIQTGLSLKRKIPLVNMADGVRQGKIILKFLKY
jgi:hypothetical protein